MLDIVASYHCIQFQRKLKNQTWKNGQKHRPGLIFTRFGPNLAQFFFRFYLYYMLCITASYHCTQFQGKPMNQTWENGKKNWFQPRFWPNLPKTFLCILPLLDVIHCCKLSLHAISRKTNAWNLRKWQKT